MSVNPELSIIVPNYNNGQYIKDCIESILSQSFDDYEIIIADDRSDDNSREIINEYVDKYPDRIKKIFNEYNLGVSRNRHNAILSSTGRYITTLDSDDYYYSPKKLAAEIRLIEEHKKKYNSNIIAYS
ncbi:MAG: glycosyltransferase family 2 protein, partial [Desulfobacteraceae bacterium]|nr:glycosyltransferase family 2 protein [Desulfobacteraceae bacterium]